MRTTTVLTLASLAATALATFDLGDFGGDGDYEHGDYDVPTGGDYTPPIPTEECEDDGGWGPIKTPTTVPTLPISPTDLPTSTTVPGPDVTNPIESLTTSWSVSTIYTTTVYTVTSCPPTVTNCPVGEGPHVTTEVHSVGTTLCPITVEPTTTPAPGPEPEAPEEPEEPEVPAPGPSTGYHPQPGPSSIITVPVAPPASSSYIVEPTTTPAPIPVGSAGRVAAGGLLAGVVGVMALLF